MIFLAAGLFGVFLGLATARKHKGNRKDQAQYAAVFGMIFALLGLIVTIVIERIIT